MAIGLAALATPLVLIVISQVSTKTATQTYTIGYSGQIPSGLDILLSATGLKLEVVADPADAAKQQVDLGVAFLRAQIDDTRLQTVLGQYNAAKAASALQQRGIDPGLLNPLPQKIYPLSSPVKAAGLSLIHISE